MQEEWFHYRYNIPPEKRDHNHIRHNNFAVNEVFSVSFFDSLIAIEKRRIPEPYQTRH